MDDMEARALKLGAVALVRLSKPDFTKAVEDHPSDRPVGNIVCFPARERADLASPVVYEDHRWADPHKHV